MSALAQDTVLGRINALLAEIDGEKSASEMDTSGSSKKDPGGYDGPSSHPSAKTDGNCGAAPMGSRAKEHESDIKETSPAATDSTDAGLIGDQEDAQYNIGAQQSAVGGDPKVEDKYKDRPDDPGTSHPANADDVGSKYASLRPEMLFKEAFSKLNDLLAALADNERIEIKVERDQPQQKQAQQNIDPAFAAQQGYQLSEQLLNEHVAMQKAARAQHMLSQIIKEAEQDADNVGQYLQARAQLHLNAIKEANELPPEAMAAAGGMPPEAMAAGGMPPEGAPAPAELPPEMGGPAGGPGGELPPEMAGEGGAPGEHEAALEELANALIEMGVSPEELLAAAEQAGAGEGGAPAPGPEEAPPKMASALPPRVQHMAHALTKRAQDAVALGNLARDVITLRDRGRLKIKAARQGTQMRSERDEIKSYIREACGLR